MGINKIKILILKNLRFFNISSKGQFFSPDILIALLVFLMGLFLFINSSTFVFSQVNLFESRNNVDNIAHSTIDSLVKTSGSPVNWNNKELDEINFFGLAKSENIIDKNKILSLIFYLDNNYEITKERLGLGEYDFYLRVVGFDREIKLKSINFVSTPKSELVYSRIVYFDGEQVLLEGVVIDG